MRAVMWFRRDLRLRDNPALLAALAAADEVVPLFVLDGALWNPAGANRKAFLAGCLRELDNALGGHLVVRHGPPERVVPTLAREVEASGVFAAEDFGPYGRARDERVAAHVDLLLTGTPYAIEPGEIRNRAGAPYQVFTPFFRAWRDHGWPDPLAPPADPRWVTGVHSDGIPDSPPPTAKWLPEPGEDAARAAANRFWRAGLASYDADRDTPAADGSSRLSPYLKWGCLHPRQLLAKLGASAAEQRFRTELCWREFYADVLFHDPASARRSWNRAMATLQTDTGAAAAERFEAWAEGRTGFPFVDAGMRQLLAEGWMHNRARMVTASFLVKDLHLDWQRGARWFLNHLVDGDLASNNHGWQWVAGTGTDASPYVRVFNPVSQSIRFDPAGDYIRRYVPELAELDSRAIHKPWELPGGPPQGYPKPIVDHGAERAEALRRFHAR
ncbi:MAG TPA: deoxyribodipyrimidine photo-lyase [Thermoleophilia bacterium]|nr:deoxyribodipyrimidine photo-lyase [Thermoleophilia bacterium]